MKKLITLIVALAFIMPDLLGQTGTVTLGTGTAFNSTTVHPTPYGTYYKNHRVQYLVLASELTSLGVVAGDISAIGFEVANMNNCSPMPNYTIKAKLTSATELTTTFDNDGYTTVWTNLEFLPVVGWNTHTFTTPIVWNGTSNLLIDICFDLIPGSYTQNASVFYTVTPVSLANFYRSDSQVACGTTNAATVSPNRANMQITAVLASCIPPSNLSSSNPSTTSVVLSWIPVGTETTWNLKYGDPGFDPTTQGTQISGITSIPYTLTGLTPVTTYQFYVQADCGGGSLSNWGGPGQFTTTSDPLSGAYTINSTLPSGGTNFNNFTDFATAMNLGGFSGPVVVDVIAGTGPYNEQVMFVELPNSSTANTLTINGNGEVLQFLSTNTNERGTLKFNGTDYVTVNNLVVKALGSATGEYGWAVWLTNAANFNKFYGCQFIADVTSTLTNFVPFVTSSSATGATTAGIAASDLTVENCVAIGGYYGIVINGPTTASGEPPAENSVIINNEIKDFRLYGLYVRGQVNALISENLISRPTRAEVSTAYMLYLTQTLTNTVVTKNRMFGFAGNTTTTSSAYGIYGTGITALPGQELLIANNVVYGFQNVNAAQYGAYLLTTDFTKFYHNTISMDTEDHTGTSVIRSFYHSGNLATIDVRNNIFSVTSNSSGIKYCMYFAQTGANLPTVTSNNNVLYMGATAGTNHIGYWDGVSYTTFADWQAVPGQAFDLNSVSINPQFLNVAGGDLTPTEPTTLNIGANLLAFVPEDINGNPRSATPDPGAFEEGFVVQEYTVTFIVQDENQIPVPDAVITLGDETNAPGDYVFEYVTPGTYPFTVTVSGFLTATGEVLVVDQDVNVTVTMIAVPSQCAYEFVLLDYYGDGWNGATMEVLQNGIVIDVLGVGFTNGYTFTQYVDLTDGVTFQVFWDTPGSWPGEVGLAIYDPFGQVLYNVEIIGVSNVGTTIYQGMTNCTPPTCLMPTDLTADNITTNSALLGWQAGGNETEWNVLWGEAGFDPFSQGTLITGITATSYNLTGLLANTDYSFYVQAVCGGSVSNLTGPFNFTTLCDAFAIPFAENFDTTPIAEIPACWTRITNTVSWGVASNLGSFSAPNTIATYYNSTIAKNDWFFTPGLDLENGLTYKLSFYMRAPGWAGVGEKLRVWYGDSPTVEDMDVMIYENTNIMFTAYTLVEVTFTPAQGGVYYLGFHAFSDADVDFISIDNIEVNEVQALMPGDANCDGSVDVLDVTVIAQYIIDLNPQPFCFENADVNSNGVVNISDLILTINIILGTDLKTLDLGFLSSTAHIYLTQNGIILESDGTLSGLQFEIFGLDASQLEFLLPGFQILTNVKDNKLMGLVFNMNNEPIPAGKILLFNINRTDNNLTWGEVAAANIAANAVNIQKHLSMTAGEFEFNAFPNPSNGFVMAQLSLPQESMVVVSIVDIAGREVNVLHNGVLASGTYQFNNDMNSMLSKGVYFLRAEAVSVISSEIFSRQLKVVVLD